jgi:uncharacterized protein YhfF
MIEDLRQRYPNAVTFRFGDSDAMNRELIALVRAGKKRATMGRLADFGPGKEAKPVVGRCDIITDWDGTPAVVVRTVLVEEMPLNEISEDFALAEGENETYQEWYDDHRRYFERNGGWAPDMMMICERFEVVEDLAGLQPKT